MAPTHAEHTQANWEKLFDHAEDWRRRALTSLALGNGAGLVAYGTVVSNASFPGAALSSVLPQLWLFAVGVVFAAILPFIAYRHDAGLSAMGRVASEIVAEMKADASVEDGQAPIRDAMRSLNKVTSDFGARHNMTTRIVIATSALCFLFGLLGPLVSASLGGSPLSGLQRSPASAQKHASTILAITPEDLAIVCTSVRDTRARGHCPPLVNETTRHKLCQK